jgi:hypothetical protein
MRFLSRLQHNLFKWFLFRVYSGEFFNPFSVLDPGSKAAENAYKEERYAIISEMQPEDRRRFMRLMALNINYLGRKSHASFDDKKNVLMKGRIMQATYEYALFDLVHCVKLKQKSMDNEEKS